MTKNSSSYIALLSIVSLLLSSSIVVHDQAQYSDRTFTTSSDFDDSLTTQMELGGIPSMQASIVIDDELVWTNSYGEQPESDRMYMLGSITKTFTATAFLQLYERGLIDLDADVSEYLPFNVTNPNDPTTIITARMLLSHTAGVRRDFPYHMYWYDNSMRIWVNEYFLAELPLWENPPPQRSDLINESIVSNPDFWYSESGTSFLYSNTGFFFLSYLLEEITDQTFEEYIHENILDPLDMRDSGFLVSDYKSQLARPYESLGEPLYQLPHYDCYYGGAASLRSSSSDLAKFMIAHMNQGRYNDVRILQPESVEIMHSAVTSYYGLGWLTSTWHGHDGTIPGFLAYMLYHEQDDGAFGIILMFNRGVLFDSNDQYFDSAKTIWDLMMVEALRLYNDAHQHTNTTTTPTDTQTSTTITTPLPTTTITQTPTITETQTTSDNSLPSTTGDILIPIIGITFVVASTIVVLYFRKRVQ